MEELTSYEERLIKTWAKGSEVMLGKPASDKVIDILVDGVLDFRKAWKDKKYGDINTHLTPIVLLSKKRILELCDLVPIETSFVRNEFGLAYIDLIFDERRNRWKYINIPTLYIMDKIDNILLLPDEIAEYIKGIEITDIGRTEAACVDIMKMLVECNSIIRTFISIFKRESLGEYVAKKMIKKGYAKYIK